MKFGNYSKILPDIYSVIAALPIILPPSILPHYLRKDDRLSLSQAVVNCIKRFC